jgi:hypothetical protein
VGLDGSTAFDAALNRELQEVMQEAKRMANEIKEPADAWDLEHYLTERRREINRKYHYRYSQLTHVFGRLLYEGRVSEEELGGLREDKLKPIRFFRQILDRGRSLAWDFERYRLVSSIEGY